MPSFEKGRKKDDPDRTLHRGHLSLVAAAENVSQTTSGEPTTMTLKEIASFNRDLIGSGLSSERVKELKMSRSAGLPGFTEEDFLRRTFAARGFANNLTCYTSYDEEKREARPGTLDDLQSLMYDPKEITKFIVVGSHLIKPALWRAATDEPKFVLPLIAGVSDYKSGQHMEQDGEELIEFADELAELSTRMAAFTDPDDPGVTVEGVIDLGYLSH
jgi:hypothetical protein